MAVPPLPAAGAILLAMGLVAGCAASGGRAGLTGAGHRPVIRGTASPGARAGCAPWPAGSTGMVLVVSAVRNGQSYCVRPGQAVKVLLSGPLALAGRSEPPRLTGNALAAMPPHVHLPTTPSVSYLAVRPGTAVLTLIGLPCHSLLPANGTPVTTGTGGTTRTGGTTGTAKTAETGGTTETECATRQAARVTIVVT